MSALNLNIGISKREEGGREGEWEKHSSLPPLPQSLSFRRPPSLAVHVMSLASCCFPRQNLVEPILGDEDDEG